MTEETTHQFLQRRRRELIAQIAALKGQLAPMEAELAQIDKMWPLVEPGDNTLASALISALPQRNSNAAISQLEQFRNTEFPNTVLDSLSLIGVDQETINRAKDLLDSSTRAILEPRFAEMTIKQLVIQSLLDHFPNGATMMEIRDFIRLGYGRTIEPSSMRPQMHRLKADRVVTHDPSTDAWNLTAEKRRYYSMYNHPRSMELRTELKDDQIPPNEPITRLREMEAEKPSMPDNPPKPRNKDDFLE